MLRTHVHQARTVDLPGVAAVLHEALHGPMRVLFGDQPEKVRTLIETAYTGPIVRGYDGVLVAERGGRIVGSVLIEPVHYTPYESHHFEHVAVREFGMPRMLWGALLLWMMGHYPAPDEAYIRELAVASDCQGEGIGSMLLEQAEVWAWEHGRQRVTLWVAADNTRAFQLYEYYGYTVRKTKSNLLVRAALGFSRWYHMEKYLDRRPLMLE